MNASSVCVEWPMVQSVCGRSAIINFSRGATQAQAEHVHAPRVREDFMSGARSGVNGTPTFYVDGKRHDDSYEPDVLLAALEDAAG